MVATAVQPLVEPTVITRHRECAALLVDPRLAIIDRGHDAEPAPFATTQVDAVLRSARDLRLDVINDLAAAVTAGVAVETIGSAVLALAQFPDEAELVRRDPSMLPLAIDEVLRYDPPEPSVLRMAIDDVDLPSGVVPRGTFVELSIAMANRDPEIFTAPQRCIFGRLPNPHLTLVPPSVVHTTATVIGALLERFSVIELDGTVTRRVDDGRLRWKRLPVRLSRR